MGPSVGASAGTSPGGASPRTPPARQEGSGREEKGEGGRHRSSLPRGDGEGGEHGGEWGGARGDDAGRGEEGQGKGGGGGQGVGASPDADDADASGATFRIPPALGPDWPGDNAADTAPPHRSSSRRTSRTASD